jgi:EmrB/QacA subfamily drug resistance transporter
VNGSPATELDEDADRHLPGRRRTPDWLIITLACLGQFMVILDVSIVNVALPSIHTGLGFSSTGLQWVVNAYTLTFAGFLLLGGRAGDLYGRKRIFILGVALFSVASLLGGLATEPAVLITARCLQGVGAAALSPATLAFLTTLFPEGPSRAKAIGTWSAVAGAAGAAGSIVGGLLTEYLSWRWVLLVNVPLGVLVVLVALRYLGESRNGSAQKLDLFGAITATVGFASVVYGIVEIHTEGWGSAQVLVPLIAGLAALAAFVLVEARVAGAPLVPLRLLRSRTVSGGNLAGFFMNAAFLSMWYFISLYLQGVLHLNPLWAGLVFLPHTIAVMVGARASSRLLTRFGHRLPILGGALIAVIGFLWQAQLSPGSGLVLSVIAPGLLMSGGIGLVFTPIAAAATSGVARGEAGIVSGLLNTSRQVGGAIGLAVLTTIAAGGSQADDALIAGYDRAFLLAAAFVVLGALMTLLLPRHHRKSP